MKNYNKAVYFEEGLSSGTAHRQHVKMERKMPGGSSQMVQDTTSVSDEKAASWREFALVLLISCVIAVTVILVATISGQPN
jgi:hypothetical protein